MNFLVEQAVRPVPKQVIENGATSQGFTHSAPVEFFAGEILGVCLECYNRAAMRAQSVSLGRTRVTNPVSLTIASTVIRF
ncbi:MAG: hypothetical protein WBA89_18495 [Microcoleus sp.]